MTKKFVILTFVACAVIAILVTHEVILEARQQPAGLIAAASPAPQAGRGARGGAAQPAAAPQAPQQAGQRGGRGAEPAAAGGAVAGVTTAPLGWLLGPTGKVSNPTPWVHPLAPGTDTYYLSQHQGEEPPDEFLSNPDREFDWHDLKSWQWPAVIRSFQILGNRAVAPGQTVQFECVLEDFTGTQNGCSIGYYSPLGRIQTMNGRLQPTVPGGNVMRGSVTIPRTAVPGTWRATQLGVSNGGRSGKIYWADTHPAGKDLDIEVLSVNNDRDVDVTAPAVEWVRMNQLGQPESAIRTQSIRDTIPVFAKITDDRSGVAGARVKVQGPQSACLAPTSGLPSTGPMGVTNPNPCRYLEFELQPMVGKPGIYGAFVNVPQWWQGGEYVVYSMIPRDKAGVDKSMMYTTAPAMKYAKINLTSDAASVDTTPPQLHSVWLSQTSARLGEPVTVNAIISDDKSGVAAVNIQFNPIPSYTSRAAATLKPVESSGLTRGGAVNTNLWTGTLQTDDLMEPGEWRLERITGQDNAENKMDYVSEYNPDLDVRMTFTGGKNLFEAYKNMKKGAVSAAPGAAPAAGTPPAGPGYGAPSATPARAGASANIGVYDPIQHVITLPTGVVIQLAPGATPDPSTGKIRRLDMIPPHPARGACLNCHEP